MVLPTQPEPAPTDYARAGRGAAQWSRASTSRFAFGYRAELEKRAARQPCGTLACDYRRQLEISPYRDEVTALLSRRRSRPGRPDLAALERRWRHHQAGRAQAGGLSRPAGISRRRRDQRCRKALTGAHDRGTVAS